MTRPPASDPGRIDALTPKERECLRLVGQHMSSKQIARELGISRATVDTYCNRARAKLGVTNRYQAARLVLAAEGAPAQPAAPVAHTPPAAGAWPPPLTEIGPLGRLSLIAAGAVLIALAFGMLLSGMQTLESFLRAVSDSEGTATVTARAAGDPVSPQRGGRPAHP